MPLPWSTLVKAIPWSDVIAKAPDIAQGARKLWQQVSTRDAPHSAGTPVPGDASAPDARLAALAAQVAEMSTRQQESAELLSALATQNAELVAAVATLRQRNRLLAAATGVATAIALAALALSIGSS
ncbi:hypothetical protein [Zoogloea sp.]|uniref:hypothetical protein n=1 Tax=Zoogloea sp. TaxID=49181 RepID=UPI002C6131D1|nr:hypothetical protein [Zoogloea sp.]